MISLWSPICGTHFGDTKLVASIVCKFWVWDIFVWDFHLQSRLLQPLNKFYFDCSRHELLNPLKLFRRNECVQPFHSATRLWLQPPPLGICCLGPLTSDADSKRSSENGKNEKVTEKIERNVKKNRERKNFSFHFVLHLCAASVTSVQLPCCSSSDF